MKALAAFLRDLIRYPSGAGTLIVNLAPLFGVLFWGWGLGALVILYWLENVVVGGVTLLRMIVTGLASGIAAIGLLFIVPFFIFHYGLFCFVHGVFVMVLAQGDLGAPPPFDPLGLLHAALNSAPGMTSVLGLIAVWRLVLFATQFMLRGEFKTSNPMVEMARPYGRIITLHIAIFAGAFALIALGRPAWGMIGLIALKTLFDVTGVLKDARGPEASRTAQAHEGWNRFRDLLKSGFPKNPAKVGETPERQDRRS